MIFEILGMVVFAFVLALFHNHQGVGVIFDTGGQSLTVSTFLVAMFITPLFLPHDDRRRLLLELANRVQRTKPAHLQAPEGEVFAEELTEAAPAPTA